MKQTAVSSRVITSTESLVLTGHDKSHYREAGAKAVYIL